MSPFIFPSEINRMGIQDFSQTEERFSVDSKSSINVSPKKRKSPKTPIDMRYTGYMKFFNQEKGFGFIVMDLDGTDIFCHLDDIKKA